MELNKVGPELIPELKGPSPPQKGRASEAGRKDGKDEVYISDEAKLLQKAREIARAKGTDLDRVLRRLRDGYYDREEVIREVARKVLSELFSS